MTAAAPILSLDTLNAMPREEAARALADIFEHAPWVAADATVRPAPSVAALHGAMMSALRGSSVERQLGVIRAHPELGSKVARAELTAASRSEQGALGLDRLGEDEFARFQKLNGAYHERFDFPFIICVRRHTRDSILREFERRLDNTIEQERATAIDEIGLITRLRLCARVTGPGAPKTDGLLTTHVLDVSTGRPAQGIAISLYEVGGAARGLLMRTITNADGRTDVPLVGGGPLRIGTYELVFDAKSYFGARKAFFDDVIVRFAIAEPESHYHVPLLLTPWSYATYRGS